MVLLIFPSPSKRCITFILLSVCSVCTEQIVTVAGGVIAGILLFVLIGITAYLLWKKLCLIYSYEELPNPVKTPPVNAILQDQSSSEIQPKRYVILFLK